MTVSYTRTPGNRTRWFEGEAFVITPVAIENLPGVSAIVWRWLLRPHNAAELSVKLEGLFPDVESQKIADDMRTLLEQLERRKLVVPVSAPAARKAARRRSTER